MSKSTLKEDEGLMVMGGGLSRTGTLTLKFALDSLGYNCYHMTEMLKRRGEEYLWIKGENIISKLPSENYDKLFKEYRAAVDYPAVGGFDDIVAHYKENHDRDLKVILTIRKSPEKWYSSVSRTLINAFDWGLSPTAYYLGPPAFYSFTVFMDKQMGNVRDRESCIKAYNDHNQHIIDSIPPERLLVLTVEEDYKDGYDKLMDFLDISDPELRKKYGGQPLPKSNESMRFHMELWIGIMTRRRPVFAVTTVTLIISMLIAFWLKQ